MGGYSGPVRHGSRVYPQEHEPPKTTDEERRQIEDALAAMKKQKAEMAAAAAQARAQGIDPLTGKKILTPEQLKRKAEILAEMALSQAESERWTNYANKLDTAVTVLTAVEKSADIAIDIGSTLSPGAGGEYQEYLCRDKDHHKKYEPELC